MEKVRPWCGQPSDRGRLKNRTGTRSVQQDDRQKTDMIYTTAVLACAVRIRSVAIIGLRRSAANLTRCFWIGADRQSASIIEAFCRLTSVSCLQMFWYSVAEQLACCSGFQTFLTTDPYSAQAQLADPHTCYSKIYCKILKFLSTLLFTNKPTSPIIYKLLWIEWKANNVSVMDVLVSLCTDCQFLA